MRNGQDPVRLVVAGPGLIGRKHVALVKENADAKLVGIVGPRKEQHVSFAADQGVPLFESVGEALAAVDVDGVILATPNGLHEQQALACIERGIPVLVEKPLASTLIGAKAIMDASERAAVPILVGHHRTYNPLVEAARTFIASPEFGSPVAVQGSTLFTKPGEYFSAAPWRTKAGGGPLLINMIHEIGLLRSLFGEIESVSALVSSSVRRFEVEDGAAISLAFTNGALGTFILSDTAASSKSWEMTTGENPAFPHFPDENCYHFAGTVGSIDFPTMNFRTYLGQAECSWWSPFSKGSIEVEPADPLMVQLDHFIDVIRGRAEPRVTARDGYMNMMVLDAIASSAACGSRVRVDGGAR